MRMARPSRTCTIWKNSARRSPPRSKRNRKRPPKLPPLITRRRNDVATTAESLSGDGEVFIKETGEIVGRFPFRLRTYQRPGRVIWSLDLVVGLDVDSAIPLLNQNARLVLR